MPTYIPNATDVNEPVDAEPLATAALEFRTLKTYIRDVLLAGLNGRVNKAGDTLTGSIIIVSSSGPSFISLRRAVKTGGQLEFNLLTLDGISPSWSIYQASNSDNANIFCSAYGNLIVLQSNGTVNIPILATNGITNSGTIATAALNVSGLSALNTVTSSSIQTTGLNVSGTAALTTVTASTINSTSLTASGLVLGSQVNSSGLVYGRNGGSGLGRILLTTTTTTPTGTLPGDLTLVY